MSATLHHEVTVVRRVGLMAVAVVVLAVAAAAYYRVGWSRMEAACTAEPPGTPARHNVSYDWSWDPPGFRCTYGDGHQVTSLWF